MAREKSIVALINKAKADLRTLKNDYERSLHEQTIRDEMRVDIKNILENLRSALDYLGHDLRDKHCPTVTSKTTAGRKRVQAVTAMVLLLLMVPVAAVLSMGARP